MTNDQIASSLLEAFEYGLNYTEYTEAYPYESVISSEFFYKTLETYRNTEYLTQLDFEKLLKQLIKEYLNCED